MFFNTHQQLIIDVHEHRGCYAIVPALLTIFTRYGVAVWWDKFCHVLMPFASLFTRHSQKRNDMKPQQFILPVNDPVCMCVCVLGGHILYLWFKQCALLVTVHVALLCNQSCARVRVCVKWIVLIYFCLSVQLLHTSPKFLGLPY